MRFRRYFAVISRRSADRDGVAFLQSTANSYMYAISTRKVFGQSRIFAQYYRRTTRSFDCDIVKPTQTTRKFIFVHFSFVPLSPVFKVALFKRGYFDPPLISGVGGWILKIKKPKDAAGLEVSRGMCPIIVR